MKELYLIQPFTKLLHVTLNVYLPIGILPEIIGKWYTRKAVANETGVVDLPKVEESPEEEDPEKLCFCGEPSFGDMIV